MTTNTRGRIIPVLLSERGSPAARERVDFCPAGLHAPSRKSGKVPLNLIEVQSGAYLGEDDIVRVQDVYHRV
jgi:hypothetical protein